MIGKYLKYGRNRFEVNGFPVEELGDGLHGCVYRISEDKVIKLPHIFEFGTLENGVNIGRGLYEAGISVPKYDGIYLVTCFGKFPRFGSVMDFVPGVTLEKLKEKDEDLYWQVTQERNSQLWKAYSAGYSADDAGSDMNAIWTPDERIVLIDFAMWRKFE